MSELDHATRYDRLGITPRAERLAQLRRAWAVVMFAAQVVCLGVLGWLLVIALTVLADLAKRGWL
jgi:hypothetical protein